MVKIKKFSKDYSLKYLFDYPHQLLNQKLFEWNDTSINCCICYLRREFISYELEKIHTYHKKCSRKLSTNIFRNNSIKNEVTILNNNLFNE